MNKLNCVQYKQLKKYERYLRTAHYANYITGMSTMVAEELRGLYERITGLEYKKNMSCTRCRLDLCKKLGKLYFAYEENNLEKKKTNDYEREC